MEGERDAADQPSAADRAKEEVGLRLLRRQLVEGFEPGASLPCDDLGIVEGMQQRQVILRRNLPGALGGDLLAGAIA